MSIRSIRSPWFRAVTPAWPTLVAVPIPTPPSEVAVGIPADLLRRRPDVRRAERQLAAQSVRIGVAVSDLYPHREGIVDYTRVFQIQQDLVVQQDQEAFARGNVALNLIGLYREPKKPTD